MTKPRIAFVTGKKWEDWTDGDALLRNALSQRGIDSERYVWSEGVDGLSGFDGALIRSCWDYHKKPEEFAGWLARLDGVDTPIWNPPEVLRWNMNKMYLGDLDEAGLLIIPSAFFPKGSNVDLSATMDDNGWERVVVKPLIGASGYKMAQIDRNEVNEYRDFLKDLVEERGLFVQPFLEQIQQDGEWSFVFFGGEYQYAIHKIPGEDDFRAHNHRGGTYRRAQPKTEWIQHVQSLVERFPKDCIYQRMDGLIRNDQLLLMEVEALEPSFYFSYYPAGAEKLAEVIDEKLSIHQPI